MMDTAPPTPGATDSSLSWTALVTRVAWDLQRARVRATREILVEVCEHVLLAGPLPERVGELEDRAGRLVVEYLERVLANRYRGPQPEQPPLPPVEESWRIAVEAACDPLSLQVFRMRYGDGLPATETAARCRIDPAVLQAVVEGLREVAREEARARGVDPVPRSEFWVDALLARIASAAGTACPRASALLDLSRMPSSAGRRTEPEEHVGTCPRCARAVRLLRAGLLRAEDLQVPPDFPPAPSATTVVALHLHPQGRQHQKGLAAALGPGARRVGDDTILVEADPPGEWKARLAQRVRMGLPPREQVRGALLQGPGRFTARAVLGPAPVAALEASRARPWGEVDGIPVLPDSLPPPPSVARWWTWAIAVGLAAVGAGAWALLDAPDPAAWPLEVEGRWGGGALMVRFDVDDAALVNVYRLDGGAVEPVLESERAADKAEFATGEGDYEVVVLQGGVVVVSTPEPLPGLSAQLRGVPPELVKARVAELHPRADAVLVLPP